MNKNAKIKGFLDRDYKYGFTTDIPAGLKIEGLSEKTIRQISRHKKEPDFVLQFRLRAYKKWLQMKEPRWINASYPKIDFQKIIYYSEPKVSAQKPKSLAEIDPQLRETFEKLGIPLIEQKRLSGVAVDAIFDSVSVATTFKKELKKMGIIFCSLSEAIIEYPDLVKKYMGSVVPPDDNFYSALNSAVFTDGSFVYIPKGITCPMDLSTYFRINTQSSGQFERTLIVCEKDAKVSYLEGCTAPRFDEKQLHAAVVEIVAMDNAQVKYSTVQNWYAGDKKTGRGGIYNFVTKRGKCLGKNSKISWTQVETGASITWKYPSCILLGDNSVGEFYSVALTNGHQQADTGSKMIHVGKNTKSSIISKGISAGQSRNSYRGIVKIGKTASGAKNYTQCDSLIIGDKASANTFPDTVISNSSSTIEHEAKTSKISEDQLLYLRQRGISTEDSAVAIINGFCRSVFTELPTEFALEADQLLKLKLENTIG